MKNYNHLLITRKVKLPVTFSPGSTISLNKSAIRTIEDISKKVMHPLYFKQSVDVPDNWDD